MSRLIALYPSAWRDRYELEFRTLMTERPPSPRDRFDIVRGAFDARLHPQVNRTTPDGAAPRIRLAAGVAVLGGALWIAGALAFVGSSVIPSLGYKETTVAILVAMAAVVISGVAAAMVSRSLPGRPTVLSLAAVSIVLGGLAMTLPWPVVFLGYFGAVIGTIAFGLIATRWVGAIGVVIAIAALPALATNTEDERALLMVPLGAAWILFGLVLAVRDLRSPGPDVPRPTT